MPMTDVVGPRMRPDLRRHRHEAAVGPPGPVRAGRDVSWGSGAGTAPGRAGTARPMLRFWIFPRKSKTSAESSRKVSQNEKSGKISHSGNLTTCEN